MKKDKNWNLVIALALLSFTTFVIILLITLAPKVDKINSRNRGRTIDKKEQTFRIQDGKDSLKPDLQESREAQFSGFL